MLGNSAEQPPLPEIEKEYAPLGFNWISGSNGEKRNQGVSLAPEPEDLNAYIVYASPLPDSMSAAEKEKLTRYAGEDGEDYWLCGFGEFDLEKALDLQPAQPVSLVDHMEANRGDEVIEPLRISPREVADVVGRGSTVIYTGAGISIAAGTPDMEGFMSYLGIDRSQSVDEFSQMVMFNPEGLQHRLQSLQESFFGEPTPAHEALAEIQRVTGVPIVTENLDKLGEISGQELIKRKEIAAEFPDEKLQRLDCIVTVGLRVDDSGLLFRFKEVNPEGRIIAMNIEPPPYLDESDYYLEGDAQETVPEIARLLRE